MNENLKKILSEYKTTSEFHSHVSMINPKGKYSIGRDGLDVFFKEYCKIIYDSEDANIGIAEAPIAYQPVIADIDLKVKSEYFEDQETIYTDEQLKSIILAYQCVLKTILETPTPENLICFVLEKEPYSIKTSEDIYIKNGFHLHFPYTFLGKLDIERHLTPRVKKIVSEQKVFENLGIKDSGDVIDSITGKPWLMYGSKKDGEGMKPYLLTRIYDNNYEEMTIEDALKNYKIYNRDEHQIKLEGKEWYYLPRVLSTNPKNRDISELRDNLEIITKSKSKPKKERKPREISDKSEDISDIEHLCLNVLDKSRSSNYNDWMNTLWAIHHSTKGSDDGLDIFLKFSNRSPEKYNEDECISLWERTECRNDGYTFSSICYWARLDNEKEYTVWRKSKAERYIQDSLNTSGSHNDIANAMYKLYGDRYICANITQNQWYEFKDHIWEFIEDAYTLRLKISGELVKIYGEKLTEAGNGLTNSEDEGEKAKWNVRIKVLQKIISNLKSAPFKTNIMKECKEVFYDEHFNKLKDKNKFLIAFKNGVYDFKEKKFRPGIPSDKITMAMPINYFEFREEDERIQFVYRFLQKIFPDKSVRDYFMDVSSEIFIGGNKRKKVYFWSGEGDNGKSITQTIFEKILGPLAIKLPTSLITGKRAQSSSACPELVRAGNGVRWTVLQEPDKRDVMNIGILKELSGNDTFFARGLYKEGSEIEPMFKVVVICNDPPSIPYSDKATWNRIRVIPFESTFCDDAPATFEEQLLEKRFPVDREFEEKIPGMLEPFAWVLIHHRNKELPHREPEKVRLATEAYRIKNDVYRQFIEEQVVEDEKGKLSIAEIYSIFKDWYKESMPGHVVPNKNEVKEYFIKAWGEPEKAKWKGYRIKTINDEIDAGEAFVLDGNDLVDYSDAVQLPL
jgi:P4 family phage/plasmid primase-like protien